MDMATGNLTERYLSGANATDLTVTADREGAVDALASVAWSRGRVGWALLRLHSEWDGAARRGLKPEQAFGALKQLPAVRSALLGWAHARKPDRLEILTDGTALVDAFIAWFLSPTCPTCNGTMWVTRSNKPKQPCTECHGTGEARIPMGNEGRALEGYVRDCLYSHRASIRGRMAR